MNPPTTTGERRYLLELCGNRAGYEVTPKRKLGLDLGAAEKALGAAGHRVLTNAGILLVAQVGPVDVSVFESGRLLLKTQDARFAEAAADATFEALGVSL